MLSIEIVAVVKNFLLNYFKLLKRWFVYIAVHILLYDVRRCVVDVEPVKALVMF